MINISKAAQEYLAMRRQLGFRLSYTGCVLKGFSAYLLSKKSSYITVNLAVEYAMLNKNVKTIQWSKKLKIITLFARYLKAFDPRTEIPPPQLIPCSYQRPMPYIYKDIEILKLVESCKNLTKKKLLNHTYYTFFGLIAVTGMRTGEARRLSRDDVDLKQGIITIRESKFLKSRQIPIHSSTVEVLKAYVQYRDQYFRPQKPQVFFVTAKGKILSKSIVSYYFKKACYKAGLCKEGVHPRILDFRHTFAVKVLKGFYQKGLDVDASIPLLSAYLGNVNPHNTYWYLSVTPDLLNIIRKKLEKKIGGQP